MATHKTMREDLDSAFHTLTHPHRKDEAKQEQGSRVVRELHLKQLEDGTLHHEMRHPNGLQVFDTTHDLDLVHDLLEQHFGTENEGEQEEREEHGEQHEEHSHY
jgi:hypothetical protein